MKILFLTNAFNGMAQRLWIELDRFNYQVKVCIASSPEIMINSVETYNPELVIAPFLTSKIPEKIWQKKTCFIIHPGIVGDRGASSLDWAILNGEKTWGVTILQAVSKMDAGPIWSSHKFKMRPVSKAELYRNEVTQAAARGILEAISKFQSNDLPIPLNALNQTTIGKWNPKTTQKNYTFSWNDNLDKIINKIHAADSTPGVLISLFDNKFYCYGAHLESQLKGKAGNILAQRDRAICIATKNEAIWITHLKSTLKNSIKLPATVALGELSEKIPDCDLSPFENVMHKTWQEIKFEQDNDIGYLHFNFYNGAMSTEQCCKLREAIVDAKKRVKLLVLLGGRDIWSNGIHLNVIENDKNPPQESWENINAIDDLILEVINSTNHYIICALQGNAGAGGVPLALSGDKVLTRNGIVLNPHTKNMGLYGSEYWTYLLPKRIGIEKATKFTEECLPWGVEVAKEIGLIDDFYGETNEEFLQFIRQQAQKIIDLPYFDKLILAKKFQHRKDEMNKPLESYRVKELEIMKQNFFENNMDYNKRRFCFVHKIFDENSKEFEDLYKSRRAIYRKRKWESINYKE
ncbi:MAG: hydrogenase maturation protein [Flavobacteriaceae bacterium]|mgnify:CR=1 FL=1|nr:hydrogenase maturation protein [Flavobacteriaceae bacterium]